MKMLLVVPALALLQLVSPGLTRSVHLLANTTTSIKMLREMYEIAESANATVPGHLRNATVPMMDNCEKNTFCKVQQVLLELADNKEIGKLCRSMVNYNNHANKNCTNDKLKMTNKTVTFELQGLFNLFIDCIRHEIRVQPMDSH